MSDQVHTSHSLALKLVATAALVAALLWGAWVTREIASSPEQRIVTVRLAETIGTFVEEAARLVCIAAGQVAEAKDCGSDIGHLVRAIFGVEVDGGQAQAVQPQGLAVASRAKATQMSHSKK